MAQTKIRKYLPELKSIAEKHGGILQCDDIIAFAKNPKSKLHDWFEWDDGAAAHQHRLSQARYLLRVTVEILPRTDMEYRTFVSLCSDQKQDGGGYRVTADVLGHADYRAELVEQALEEMERFEAKYSQLTELAEIFAAFRKVKGGKKRKAG